MTDSCNCHYSPCSSLQVTSDPFAACRVPTFFAVGSEGILTSVAYVEVSSRQCTYMYLSTSVDFVACTSITVV